MGWLVDMIYNNDKKGVRKGNVINCLCVMCEEGFERLLESLLMWYHDCVVRCYENGHLLIICANMSLALLWDIVVSSVICIVNECELKENLPFWQTYHAYCDGYYILRDLSRAAIVTIIEDHVVNRDRCIDIYIPVGRELRDRGCVLVGQTWIIILDIAFIALLILIISELDIVFCWSCDCLSADVVID